VQSCRTLSGWLLARDLEGSPNLPTARQSGIYHVNEIMNDTDNEEKDPRNAVRGRYHVLPALGKGLSARSLTWSTGYADKPDPKGSSSPPNPLERPPAKKFIDVTTVDTWTP